MRRVRPALPDQRAKTCGFASAEEIAPVRAGYCRRQALVHLDGSPVGEIFAGSCGQPRAEIILSYPRQCVHTAAGFRHCSAGRPQGLRRVRDASATTRKLMTLLRWTGLAKDGKRRISRRGHQ